jgi:hypothetical protein
MLIVEAGHGGELTIFMITLATNTRKMNGDPPSIIKDSQNNHQTVPRSLFTISSASHNRRSVIKCL